MHRLWSAQRALLAVFGHVADPTRTGDLLESAGKENRMQVAASIFKAYDIRGIVGTTIDDVFAEHLGRAFGSEAVAAGERAIAVGRDGRLSGPGLVAALIRGLVSTGLDVVDIGAV